MRFLWYVLLYSFLGCLVEEGYALWEHGRIARRRMLLVLPLCPVYGLGAALILSLPEAVRSHPPLLILWGMAAATAAEYGMGWFYEKVCGVSFWNYQNRAFQLHGRVCLRFSLYWGFLSLPLVYLVHPLVEKWVTLLSPALLIPFWAVFLTDFVFTALLLRSYGSKKALDWLNGFESPHSLD